jgi:hypothetical protein
MSEDQEHEIPTAELIQGFCRQAKGPELSTEAAQQIAGAVWWAQSNAILWQHEYAAELRSHPERQAMEEFADCLRRMQICVPVVLKQSRSIPFIGSDDRTITDDLLDLVNRHQHVIDAFPPRGRMGRPPDHEAEMAAQFSTLVYDLWPAEERRTRKAADAFAQIVMAWLTNRPVPHSTNSIKKQRIKRPRTKHGRKVD